MNSQKRTYISSFSAMENELRESIAHEKRSLENEKQTQLNIIKQNIEREKEELKRKLQ